MTQCKAISKQSGVRCKRRVTPGRDVCYIHGGASLSGAAHPSFKHGRYSKHIPTRLAALYAEATSDEALLDLRDDIALISIRISELLQQVDIGEAGALWKQAHDLYAEMTTSTDKKKQIAAGLELGRLIERGVASAVAWSEIASFVEARRKLVESESKRLKELGQMIPAEKLMVLLGAIENIVLSHVNDPETLRAIAEDFRNLLYREAALTLRDGGG